MNDYLDVMVSQGVALVTLDDPGRRNALNARMVDQLCEAFDEFEQSDGVRAVVLTGRGKAFCAGADLTHLGSSQRDGLLQIYRGFLRLAESDLVTIAAINGAAVGAGMNVALACDIRLAAASARFDCRFLALGLHPGGGHTWMLQRAVGPQVAAAMVLAGQVLDGHDAERVGLAWKCVSDEDLIDVARTMALSAASNPGELARRAKRSLRQMGFVESHDKAVEIELIEQLWSMDQPAFAERLAAMKARISDK